MYKSFLWPLSFIICSSLWAVTVVIDPGHGGSDDGALSKMMSSKRTPVKEKNLTLEISKLIYKELRKMHISAFLTRSLDKNLSLGERAEIADTVKADLFLSIHINASSSKSSSGFETYYLDNHKDKAVQKVEQLENKNLSGEAAVVNQILVDLVVEQTAPKSKLLSKLIHQEVLNKVAKKYRLQDRGVKPGLFYVLALTKRPAVLLEVGFISNSKDLKKMRSRKFQLEYAKAVAKGVKGYIEQSSLMTPVPLF